MVAAPRREKEKLESSASGSRSMNFVWICHYCKIGHFSQFGSYFCKNLIRSHENYILDIPLDEQVSIKFEMSSVSGVWNWTRFAFLLSALWLLLLTLASYYFSVPVEISDMMLYRYDYYYCPVYSTSCRDPKFKPSSSSSLQPQA